MKKNRNEQDWVPFEKTDTYKRFKKNHQEVSKQEGSEMDIELHNQSDIEYEKSMKSLAFVAKSLFKKFSKKSRWKLEVWLAENDSMEMAEVSCGVALKRPHKKVIYAKQSGSSLHRAIKKSLSSIEKSIKKEKRWKSQAQINFAH